MRSIVIKILNYFSRRIIDKYNPVVIGVTGSVGKSSACRVIDEILKTKYEIRHNDSSCRTDISIPLAVIGANSGKKSVLNWCKVFYKSLSLIFGKSNFYPDVLILEMGVDRPKDMEKMLKVVHPDIAVMTGLGEFPAHVKYFKNKNALVKEKNLLLKSLKKGDVAIYNYDDKEIRKAADAKKIKKISFGFEEKSNIRGEEIFKGDNKWQIEDGTFGMSFKIFFENTFVPFRFSDTLGRGQIYSALAGSAVALHLGFNLIEISEALSNYKPLVGRMNLKKGIKDSIVIDDTFNSNPASFISALETLNKLDSERKILVVGGMRELGEEEEKAYEKIAKNIFKTADLIFSFNKEDEKHFSDFLDNKKNKDKVFCFDSQKDLISALMEKIKEGDIVLVKGARADKMEGVVENITK